MAGMLSTDEHHHHQGQTLFTPMDQNTIRERLQSTTELPSERGLGELQRGVSTNLAPEISRPEAVMMTGPTTSIIEEHVSMATPSLPTPTTSTPPDIITEFQISDAQPATRYPDVGTIKSWRGALVLLITASAQMLDNVFMTGANISLPAIQREFDVGPGDLQWMISAYTLTFGGFLLLSGVMSDR